MGRFEIKVDGKDVAASSMLRVASKTLKIMTEIEKEVCKQEGTKPSLRWFIDMQSGFSYGLIAFRSEVVDTHNQAESAHQTVVWAEAMKRMGRGETQP